MNDERHFDSDEELEAVFKRKGRDGITYNKDAKTYRLLPAPTRIDSLPRAYWDRMQALGAKGLPSHGERGT